MKLLIHNLKMIRAAGMKNGWVLAELFMVFIILWTLTDMLGVMSYNLMRPLGYDMEHVYRLDVSAGGEAADTLHSSSEKQIEIVRRLRMHTEVVEEVSMSLWSLPINGGFRYGNFSFADTMTVNLRRMLVDDNYMRVFRLELENGRNFSDMPTQGAAVLSRAAFEEVMQKCSAFGPDSLLGYPYEDLRLRVFGIVKNFRDYRFGDYVKWEFMRMDEAALFDYAKGGRHENFDIVVRIRPEADIPDFRERFMKEIAPTLDVDDCFVIDLVPFSEIRRSFEQQTGEMNTMQIGTFIAAFLLINVFLGLIGTFWYRTRRRRSEIALRMSMGATRFSIFRMLIGEGLLLLTIAALPAALVCYNVALADPMLGQVHLIIPYPVEFTFGRFLMGGLLAWMLMALMIVAGICYPASKAIKIEPAEALHEE